MKAGVPHDKKERDQKVTVHLGRERGRKGGREGRRKVAPFIVFEMST